MDAKYKCSIGIAGLDGEALSEAGAAAALNHLNEISGGNVNYITDGIKPRFIIKWIPKNQLAELLVRLIDWKEAGSFSINIYSSLKTDRYR